MNDSSDTLPTGEDETIIDPSLNEAELNEPSDEEDQAADTKTDERFTEGQLLRFIRVRFPGNNRSFAFLVGKYEYSYGQKVVAMSDRGMAL